MMDLPNKENLLASVKRSRALWRFSDRPSAIEPIADGEESVWDFPRPPVVQPVASRLRVVFNGRTVAETRRGLRVVETASAPAYHFPEADVAMDCLKSTDHATVCEWKGAARYFDLVVDGRTSAQAAYTYPDPFDDLEEGYAAIAGMIVFYASRVDEAYIGDTQVTPQPGGYYSGWVTPALKGPIKGAPGSEGW